ncbi:AP-3 complex subunit mu-1 [Capsaspora owczarzaki ATCC 30864]|uniref:AP-3 complex subunit mu-1 n=1 Tax=Capsaspora owczarzaki (strain ATCC 30864) TaxID=595528 RepID=A0A0D2WQJ0_CAPO3|nr:AP-3 complex subunit mu-1 [Capsaspora owczarzaki ATCC 30864]KJE93203.1 AP-3 complex subunit mu-1 [Capsaspora owczarzaki ATCC 30864]|eukprot:XP_004347850.1 AP-3 complex subunit mu-1 [Capsaspora owczarzaki ATCC 30864]
MIQALFAINTSGETLLEKHYRGVTPKAVFDPFIDALNKTTNPDDVAPVIVGPRHCLISIYRQRIFFLAIVQTDVTPLLVFEFLHRAVDTFVEYFGDFNEASIKEHAVTYFELLDEMMDNGFPLTTESNILKELILPPSIIRSVVNTFASQANVASAVPTGQLSSIPWRRMGVRYATNAMYIDFIEELDVIIDRNGATISAEVQGEVRCNSNLSGMPDLVLSFANPRVFDDISFHPCVRFKRWESERVLSFVPPDGHFKLCSYRVGSTTAPLQIPVYVKPMISFSAGVCKLEVNVGFKQNMGKAVEDVVVIIPLPPSAISANISQTVGNAVLDPVSKNLRWDIGKIPLNKLPVLKGSVTLQTSMPLPEANPTITLEFKIQQLATSGIKVNKLDLYGEKYKPFKGVKYLTKSGRFQVRS